MDKNVCPYCGWECVEIVGQPYSGIGRGRCPNCQSNGPEVSLLSAALDTFCNPTYLLNKTGLIRLAADEVVVNVHYLLSLANATCKDTCQSCDGGTECGQCWVEQLRAKATAALNDSGVGR